MYVVMLAVPLLLLGLAVATPSPEPHTTGVNLIVGDLSAALGYAPSLEGLSPGAAERARVRGHLLFAHGVLASADTSAWPAKLRAARATNLERLRVYAETGVYPFNDDHADRTRPTFVDARGTICAVGALFAADRGRGAAERIASTHKYAFISQIDDPELASWQQTSGLSPAELALIQPAYRRPSYRSESKAGVQPFGLLDRMLTAPARLDVAFETGSVDKFDTAGVTVHAQTHLECACGIGAYATLPMTIVVDDAPAGAAAAGGPLPGPARGSGFGTAEVGVFKGGRFFDGEKLVRLGVLLPTAPRDPGPRFASARVGDAVLEHPRSIGGRLSSSLVVRLPCLTDLWYRGMIAVLRFDVGMDGAVVLASDESDRAQMFHVTPRAGIGLSLLGRRFYSLSLDTAGSADLDANGEKDLRWSTGLTISDARRNAGLRPALTVAAVRSHAGWGATLAFQLGVSKAPPPDFEYD